MLRNMSFGKRIFVIFTLLSCAVIVVSSSLYYWNAYREHKRISSDEFTQTTSKTVQQLDELIANMDVVSSQVIANRTVQQIFMQLDLENETRFNPFEFDLTKRSLLQGALWSYNSPKKIVENINVFRAPATFVSLMPLPSDEQIRRAAGLKQWESGEAKYKLLPPHLDDWGAAVDPGPVISLVRPLTLTFYNFGEAGTIEVQQAYAKVEAICSWEGLKAGMRIFVADKQGHLIYPYSSLPQPEDAERIRTLLDAAEVSVPGELVRLESFGNSGVSVMAGYGELSNADWKVFLIQPESDYLRGINRTFLVILGVGFAFTAIVTATIFLITRTLTRPLVRLRESVSRVDLDSGFEMIESSEINEVELLQRAFHEITEQIKQSAHLLVKANESQLQLKISELQAKTDPHFLYNSLMAISAAGQEGDSHKVQLMCFQLSQLFRYSSGDGMEVSLADEWKNALTYLNFMKLRYEEYLQFDIEEAGNLQTVTVPRLMLQPIIENCFTHGFAGVLPPFKLRLTCRVREDAGWDVEVSDSGIGLQEDRIEELESRKRQVDEIMKRNAQYENLKTDDMALINVYIRLKTMYPGRVSFSVANNREAESGAHIRIGVSAKSKSLF